MANSSIMQRIIFITFALIFSTTLSNAQRVTPQEAKELAIQFINQRALNDGACNSKGVDNSQVITLAPANLSHLYVFNLGGNDGFVIVSSNKNTRSILGYGFSGAYDEQKLPSSMKAWLSATDSTLAMLDSCAALSKSASNSTSAASKAHAVMNNSDLVANDAHSGVSNSPTTAAKAHTTVPALSTSASALSATGSALSTTTSTFPSAETNYPAAVAPLIKTEWHQEEPYWNNCPMIGGVRCLTGCVATALAQVMYFWRTPAEYCQAIPSYSMNTYKGVYTVDTTLHSTRFDWDLMAVNYDSIGGGTSEQQEAVAKLMRYTGQAVKMLYDVDVSLSYNEFSCNALINYFGYDDTAKTIYRSSYTNAQWERIIYDELSAGRPVLYGGDAQEGGHAFICDGYDGNGLFHFNWGWGYLNGYFAMSLLNPAEVMDKFYYSGFNMDQEAIIGVKPATRVIGEYPNIQPYGNIKASARRINYTVNNRSNRPAMFQVAFGTIDADGAMLPVVDEYIELDAMQYDDLYFNPQNIPLPQGSYKLYPMARCVSVAGDDWHLISNSSNYVALDIGDSIEIHAFPKADFVIDSVKFDVDLAINRPNYMYVYVTNRGEEYAGSIHAKIDYSFDSKDHNTYIMDSQDFPTGVYIDQGESDVIRFYINPSGFGNARVSLLRYSGDMDTCGVFNVDIPAPSDSLLGKMRFIPEFGRVALYDDHWTATISGDMSNLVPFDFAGDMLVVFTFNFVDAYAKVGSRSFGYMVNNEAVSAMSTNYRIHTFNADDMVLLDLIDEWRSMGAEMQDSVEVNIGYLATPNIFVEFSEFNIPVSHIITGVNDGFAVPSTRRRGVYDMWGHYISDDEANLARGVYIKDGKKIIVK